ncbi:ABC transporter substrate-binding protein [Paenibacillus sp. BC26]|uniref:ABC transporter substrate-binding protein n=1 Tax=Paenibacillus sp. BC26 TaxID=1881032 RepID=UPI0008E09ABF|nr:ABC transporter substrate-binding protein [Paenibacillus sp. BC26]SFT13293.1 putative spermidine/putrescine transport system substrate-binding protein [Paenibacillus sp. BC26]
MKNTRNALIIFLLIIICLITAACSGKQPIEQDTAAGNQLLSSSWDQVLAEAKGQTVNWYMWGGSDAINEFVDRKYGRVLKEQYGINLHRVPISDTAEAVNKVLNEKQAGKNQGGSVDLIWINGENFATLKQASALFGPFAAKLPNAKYVDYDNPAVVKDFGLNTEGYESVWGSAQFQFVYDANRIQPSELPHTYMELKQWVEKHPGRFTYNAPPDFTGIRFVKQLFYEVSGGYQNWSQPFDQQRFDSEASKVWDYLNELKPSLWRKGETYPKTTAELMTLFNNNEVDFAFTQDIGGITTDIGKGKLPKTAKPYVFDTGTIGDYHYVAIPYDASHKAAAMVVANLILDPKLQFEKADPASGWGDGIGIDPTQLDGEYKTLYTELTANSGATAVPADVLLKHKLPDLQAAYTLALEEGWKNHVLFQK